MEVFEYPSKNERSILALGPESNGNFSVFSNNTIYFSQDFGDLLIDANFSRFQKELVAFLKKEKIKPVVILTDLHPLYKTTILGSDLAKKYKARHIQIQHHLAHIFSAVGESALQTKNYKLQNKFYGVALDGTGYGTDGKIWGGEVFRLQTTNYKLQTERVGHLENQVMIGGDLAIQEPARMLISILDKFLSKEKVYARVKKYYSAQEFEALYSQLKQNFNCIETSSAGRVLDAVSVLLGFAKNERKYKHEPVELLEKNSTKPFTDLKPKFEMSEKVIGHRSSVILNTTYLFVYLIKNLHKDKKRLAATAQLYIAQGIEQIIQKNIPNTKYKIPNTFLAGGISNNKIISEYFKSTKIKTGIPSGTPAVRIPRGDAGLSLGQLCCYLASPTNKDCCPGYAKIYSNANTDADSRH